MFIHVKLNKIAILLFYSARNYPVLKKKKKNINFHKSSIKNRIYYSSIKHYIIIYYSTNTHNVQYNPSLTSINNFNSRSISVRSKNKTVNKDNVIRMTLYRGQPIEYRSIINVLRHSATYSIANVKTLEKKKAKRKKWKACPLEWRK